jgi:hypothetical protein
VERMPCKHLLFEAYSIVYSYRKTDMGRPQTGEAANFSSLLSLLCARCPAELVRFDLITLIIFVTNINSQILVTLHVSRYSAPVFD